MKIKICDKCKSTNIKTLVPKLKDQFSIEKLEIGCINYCGIGRTKIVIIANNYPIIGDNEEDVINKLKMYLKKM